MTRIIAGRFKGRRLEVPKGRDIRPTTDRMRERLFSMLMHSRYPDMRGAHVADLFAGTGGLGLEALSRGAAHVTFVEKARGSLDCLKGNIDTLGVGSEVAVLPVDASKLPQARTRFDIIFMDPPYRMDLVRPTLDAILAGGWLAEDGVIVCELATDDRTEFPESLSLSDERSQGQQRIVFLSNACFPPKGTPQPPRKRCVVRHRHMPHRITPGLAPTCRVHFPVGQARRTFSFTALSACRLGKTTSSSGMHPKCIPVFYKSSTRITRLSLGPAL